MAEKYIVVQFQQDLYKIDLRAIQLHRRIEEAELKGLPINEINDFSDQELLSHSYQMTYSEVQPDLIRLTHNSTMNIRLFWPDLQKTIMHPSSIELILEKELTHD